MGFGGALEYAFITQRSRSNGRPLAFRRSMSFGKRQEYSAVAELLKRGFDVYMTLVDDQQIDCVIRKADGRGYLDVQIKARSKDCAAKNAGRFAAMQIPDPRPSYFFIFYSEQANMTWIIPSLELVKLASQNKRGENKGKWSINLTGFKKGSGVYPLLKFKRFEGAFQLLK